MGGAAFAIVFFGLMKAVVLYNDVASGTTEDDLDVLVQRDVVTATLKKLGYDVASLPVTLNLQRVEKSLQKIRPVFVFNLVEAIAAVGRFIYFAPALLEHLHIPFTGASSDALYLTTNKVLTKERLKEAGLPTPAWSTRFDHLPQAEPPYIIKPVWEDASVGLDEQALVYQPETFTTVFKQRMEKFGVSFAESFIDGREFNLSILDSDNGPQPLPPAEIRFEDYPQGKPRLVDYKAKWESESFEYSHTVRHFDFPTTDKPLLEKLTSTAIQSWHLFNLRGYARVDFRVDQQGNPWILEVNANPCISPDSGFVAASEQAGLSFKAVIERIVNAALSLPI
jgi:D-alanine-D-alanine ligase